MTGDIISAVSKFFTPEIIGKMASASGMDRGIGTKAVEAGVPAILGGLADAASKPGGAQRLASAMAEQPASMLANLASALAGSPAQVADKGGGLLASLLGGPATSNLVSTIARFVGVGDGPMRTMLGLAAPAVLGVLGREQRAAGEDGPAFARVLASQKDEIASAMPSGLSDLLGFKGTYERPAHAEERGSTYEPARHLGVVGQTPSAPARPSWPYWALPLAALAGLLWYVMSPDRTTQPDKTATSTSRLIPDGTTKTGYLAKAAGDWTSMGAYHNQDVYNRSGEKIGTVKELLVTPEGRVGAAVIGVGRFLGVGEKDVAVPFSALQFDGRENNRRIVIDAMKETLQGAPTFETIR